MKPTSHASPRGQPVTFTVDALPNKTFTGHVSQVRLNATMVQNAVTYTAVIDVEDKDSLLIPYLTANVEIAVNEHAPGANSPQ